MSDQNDEALAEPWAKKREDANATPPQHDCDALNIETIESIKYETSNSSDKCEHIEQNGKLELNGVGGKVGVTENGILETDNGILETDNGISEIDNGILETDKGILETNGGEKLDTKDDNKSDSKLGDETSGCDTKEDRKRRISGGELSDISEKLDSVEGVDNEICDVEVKNETVIVMAEEKVAVVTAEDGKPDVEVHIEFSAMEEGNVGVARAVDEKIYHQFYQPAPMRRLEHPVDKSLMLSVIYSLFYLVLVLVVFCPIAATLAVLLPVGWVLRRCAACFCCCAPNRTCACCCSRMLSHTDNVWLHDAVLNQMIAQSVIKLERGLGLNQFREIIKNRLVLAEEKNGRKMYPRFTKRVVPVYSGYAWKTDDEFMIENHVYSMPDNIQTEEELRRHVADMSTKQLPMDHPLWEMQFLTNFGEEGDTVVLFRVHPCVCDGISLVQILYKSLVDNPSIWQLKPRFGQSAFVFNAIRAMLVGPLVFVHKWIVMSNDCNPLHGPQLSGKWTVAWSKPFSFARATRIKQVTRSTLNDVLLAVCAGNLRNYLKAKGVSHPYNMMAAIPVDMRGQGAEILMGAHFGLNDLTLPTNTEGAIPRLWEVRREMDELKNAADPVVLYGSQWVLANALPDRWFRRMWWQIWHKATCFISSLPGPDTVLTFSSHEIKSIIYWMPPGPNVAVSISFLSYADQVRMAVIADKSVLPDPDLLTSDFIDQVSGPYLILTYPILYYLILSYIVVNWTFGKHFHENFVW